MTVLSVLLCGSLTQKPDKSHIISVFAEGQSVVLHPRAATDVPQHQHTHPPVAPAVPPPQPPQPQRPQPGYERQTHSRPCYVWACGMKRHQKRRNQRKYGQKSRAGAARRHVCLGFCDDVDQRRRRSFAFKGAAALYDAFRSDPGENQHATNVWTRIGANPRCHWARGGLHPGTQPQGAYIDHMYVVIHCCFFSI